MPPIKVLHLTPHLNGGLGRILFSQLESNCLDSSCIEHHICLFEKPLDDYPNFTSTFPNFLQFQGFDSLGKILDCFDIVQIELWNHPLIYKLLLSRLLDRCSLLTACCHIQGNSPPQLLSPGILNYFDHIFFTGTFAYESWLSDPELLDSKVSSYLYPIDFNYFDKVTATASSRVKLCYVGTVSYTKMHPQFFKLLTSLSQKIELEVVGQPDNDVVRDANLVNYPVIFSGFMNDVRIALSRSDIFYYPLRNNHYGTGEIALLEAMSSSLPPVALNNFAESSIILDSFTGFIGNNLPDFTSKLSRLIDDSSLRQLLGANARDHIINNNSLIAFALFLSQSYQKLLIDNAFISNSRANYFGLKFRFTESYSLGFSSFLLGLDSFDSKFSDIQQLLLNYFSCPSSPSALARIIEFFEIHPYYKYSSKGGLGHYLHVFPDDIYLNKVNFLLNEGPISS